MNSQSYQVWFQFTQWFQRGRMKWKFFTDNDEQMLNDDKISHERLGQGRAKKERDNHICVNLLWTSYTWCIKHIDECVLLSSINTNQQMQVYFFVKTFFCHHDNIPNPILWVSFIHEHKKNDVSKISINKLIQNTVPFISTKYLLSQLIYMNCKRKGKFTMRKKVIWCQASKQAYCVHGVAL